jgi:hypothetical protein
MKTSTSIATIAPAVVAAAAELGPVAKDATNPAFRNRYATLDAIMEAVRPVLARHGLAVIQTGTTPETVDGRLTSFGVETMLLHKSGEWIASSVTLPIEKMTAQGAGSAMSYGRRYGISALLGLTAEDDDGNAASSRPVAVTQTRSSEPTPEPGQRLYEAVPATPRAKPFNGTVAEAMAWKIPFKKSKHFGRPLSDLPQEDLESLHDFLKKDPDKFGDIIQRVEAVLTHYFAEDTNNPPPLEDLPF